jgi:hypothetical protein
MKTYVDFFSAESMAELTRQINEEAEARELEIVNTSLSVDYKMGWFFALVTFKHKNSTKG